MNSFIFQSEFLPQILAAGMPKKAQGTSYQQNIANLVKLWSSTNAIGHVMIDQKLDAGAKKQAVDQNDEINKALSDLRSNPLTNDAQVKIRSLSDGIRKFYSAFGGMDTRTFNNIGQLTKSIGEQSLTEVEKETSTNGFLDNQIIKVLLDRLSDQIGTTSADSMSREIGTKMDAPVQPKVGDLTSFDNFISWLGKNEITYHNLPIVVIGNRQEAPRPVRQDEGIPNERKEYHAPAEYVDPWREGPSRPPAPLPGGPGMTFQSPARASSIVYSLLKKAQTAVLPSGQEKSYRNYGGIYWIHPEYLKNFIIELQRSAAKSNNNLFTHLIGGRGGLLEQTNAVSDRLGIKVDNKIDEFKKEHAKTKQQAPQEDQNQGLDDETVVDGIVDVLMLNNPRQKGGNVPLMIQDLKSPQSFSEWVQKYKLKYKVTEQDKEAKEVEDVDDYRKILPFFAERARLFNISKSKSSEVYGDLVQKLIQAYGGSSANAPGNNKQREEGENKLVSWKPGSGEPLPPQIRQKLISMRYPLIQDRIDMPWIAQWVGQYVILMQTIPGGNVGGAAADDVLDMVGNIASGYDIAQQPLSASITDIYNEIRLKSIAKGNAPNKASQAPGQYLLHLSRMLSSLERVLASFKSQFYDSMPPEWRPLFDRQYDGSEGSLAAFSKRHVAQWISDLPMAQQRVERAM